MNDSQCAASAIILRTLSFLPTVLVVGLGRLETAAVRVSTMARYRVVSMPCDGELSPGEMEPTIPAQPGQVPAAVTRSGIVWNH